MTTKKQQTQTSTEVTPTETDSGKAISADQNILTYSCGWCLTGFHETCRGDLSADNGKVYQCECKCETANSTRGHGDRLRHTPNNLNGNPSKRSNTK